MAKNKNNNQMKTNSYIFFIKIGITYPLASIKDVQATGEAFSPQKRTSRTSKQEIFSIFNCHFCPPGFKTASAFVTAGFRIRIRIWIRIRIKLIQIRIQIADPDTDPGGQKRRTKIEKSTEFSCFEVLDVLF
jgi:hypothetical protein